MQDTLASAPRASCRQMLEELRRGAAFFEEMARCRAIRPWLAADGSMQLDLETTGLSPAARQRLGDPGQLDYRALLEVWLYGQVVATGPKIFQPTLEQCLAMEQVAPRIALDDYVQPFPVMLVELPEAYGPGHTCPTTDEFRFKTGLAEHAPIAVLIGTPPLDVKAIWLTIIFNSRMSVRLAVLPTDQTIEDGLVREFGKDSYIAAEHLTHGERVVTASSIRLAVTAMLLLTDYGCKELGPANRALPAFATLRRAGEKEAAGHGCGRAQPADGSAALSDSAGNRPA